MRTIVVLPTYNERENVSRLLGAVRSTLPEADILVVDDHSPDGTASLVEEVAAELGQIKLLRRPGKHGLGSAYREGFAVALDEGYDAIVSMDVDFSHDPASLPDLLRLLDAGADAVARHADRASILRLDLFACPTKDTCDSMQVDGRRLRFDGLHYRDAAARLASQWILDQLVQPAA